MKRTVMSALVLVCLVPQAHSQEFFSDFVSNTVDVRTIGMGKAGVASAQGGNVLFLNPGLLSLEEHIEPSVGFSLRMGAFSDEYTEAYDRHYNQTTDYSIPASFKLSHVSAALPFRIEGRRLPVHFAIALGYHSVVDASWRFEENAVESSTESEHHETEINGGVNAIAFGVSVGLLDRLSVGLALNIGSMSNLTVSDIEVDRDDSTFTTSYGKETYEIDGTAFFPSLGFTGKPLENMWLSIFWRPRFTWRLEENAVTWYDSLTSGGSTAVVDTAFTDTDQATHEIHSELGLGFYYQVVERLGMALDFALRPFSNLESTYDEAGTPTETEDWLLKNGVVVRGGLEGPVALRCGAFLDAHPVRDQDWTVHSDLWTEEAPAYALGVTLGAGLKLKAVRADVGFQYWRLSQTITAIAPGETEHSEYEDKLRCFRLDASLAVTIADGFSFRRGTEAVDEAAAMDVAPEQATPRPEPAVEPEPHRDDESLGETQEVQEPEAETQPVRELARPRRTYAIMKLRNSEGVSGGEVELITDRFRNELFATGKATVMEREQMRMILEEQGFQQSGACSDQGCMVEAGQLLGVEIIISGSIGRLGSTYLINLRAIEVATARIIDVVSVDVRGEIDEVIEYLPELAAKLIQP